MLTIHSFARFAAGLARTFASAAALVAATSIFSAATPALAVPTTSCAAALEEIQAAWPWQDRNIGTRDRSVIEIQLGMAKYLCRQGRNAEALEYINFAKGLLLTRGLGGR